MLSVETQAYFVSRQGGRYCSGHPACEPHDKGQNNDYGASIIFTKQASRNVACCRHSSQMLLFFQSSSIECPVDLELVQASVVQQLRMRSTAFGKGR